MPHREQVEETKKRCRLCGGRLYRLVAWNDTVHLLQCRNWRCSLDHAPQGTERRRE